MLLKNSKALEKLAAENANLFVKIASKIKEFITKLRKAQADMYGGNEELHDSALRLREALKSLEELQEVFDNALENSIRNMRNALAEAENAKAKANLDVLEKAAEKEGLQLSEEIDDSRLTGYRARDRMNKEGELINDFYQALSKKQWATYYRQIANGGYLSSEIGTVFISRIDNKLVFSEKMPITSDTQDFQVVDVWQFDSMDDLDTVYYYLEENMKDLGGLYDRKRAIRWCYQFYKSNGEQPIFRAYSRTSYDFSDSYTSKGQRLGTEGVYEDSQRGTGREKIPSEDKRYSEREIGVSSEENNESNSREQLKFSEETSEESSEKYSYEALTSKSDMKITTLNGTVPSNRADVVAAAKKNAASVGKVNKDGSVSVYVSDTGTDVILSKKGLIHGLDRRFQELAPVTVHAGEIIENSILINELTPSKEEADASYVLIGAAEDTDGNMYVVRSVINRHSNELSTMDVLYAMNAKKGTAALNAPLVSTPNYRTTISIAELLEYVNRYFPDVLPESVLRHFGHTSRPQGVIGESALYSEETDENTKAVRNERTLRKQVDRLKTLVKLQGNITHGSVFTDASVGKQATELRAKYNIKQNANSKVKEALHKFYAFISTAKEFDWNDIQREAGKAAAILLENERLNVGDFFIFM